MSAPLLDQFSQVFLVSHNDIEESRFREQGRMHSDKVFHKSVVSEDTLCEQMFCHLYDENFC